MSIEALRYNEHNQLECRYTHDNTWHPVKQVAAGERKVAPIELRLDVKRGAAEKAALAELEAKIDEYEKRGGKWDDFIGRLSKSDKYKLMANEIKLENRVIDLEQQIELTTWQPIETAPKGSGEDGPNNVTHPDYIAPPQLLLVTEEGVAVGHYDWYYHRGYGRGYYEGVSPWISIDGEHLYPTHWLPLPKPPAQGASS